MCDDRSSQPLLFDWQNVWERMLDHPARGVGFFNFIPYYEAHYRDDMLYQNAQLPHNIFIQVGTDAGFLGLGVYMFVIIYAYLSARALGRDRNNNVIFESTLAKPFNLSLIGFLVAGQFVTVAYYPFLWIHLSMIIALQNIAGKRAEIENG